METVLKSKYFYGFNQISREIAEYRGLAKTVYWCINSNYVEFLSLLTKYCDKSNKLLRISINKNVYDAPHPLLCFLNNVKKKKQENKEYNDKLLHLYFDLCDKCQIVFGKDIYNKAIQICDKEKNNENYSKYKQMIEEKYQILSKYPTSYPKDYD